MQTFSFDPDNWVSFKKSEPTYIDSAAAHIRLHKPGAVYASFDGKVYLFVCYGTEFKLTFANPDVQIKCDVPFSMFVRSETRRSTIGTPLTNMDKRPGVSAAEAMVQRGMREAEIKNALQIRARRVADIQEAQRRVELELQEEVQSELLEAAIADENEPTPEPDTSEEKPEEQ